MSGEEQEPTTLNFMGPDSAMAKIFQAEYDRHLQDYMHQYSAHIWGCRAIEDLAIRLEIKLDTRGRGKNDKPKP